MEKIMLENDPLRVSFKSKKDESIICDFDGTITPFDVTDAILSRFAHEEWESIENDWVAGKITARECMFRQVALINAPVKELDDFLDSVPVTSGFKEFIAFCKKSELDILIVSDGMDYAIKRILANHNLTHLPVIANRLTMQGASSYKLKFPYGSAECPSGVCKCSVAKAGSGNFTLIGDGQSDCCLAGMASFVFAKEGKKLQKHCALNARPHTAYNDFFDVLAMFENTQNHDYSYKHSNLASMAV